MGIFDRIQAEIEAREKQDGITPADLLDLSPQLRRLMNRITRDREMDVEAAAELLGESSANTVKMLNALVDKGYLERVEREEHWVYRTRFARTRGRDIPAGIWSVCQERTDKACKERTKKD
jgi:DNA-binding MarR family transcriptional regulator